MKKVLIISGHPTPSASTANKTILADVEKKLPQAQVRVLADLYPTGNFDVAAEQQALLDADVIVFAFPFYWYAMPGLLKTYVEKVFAHGFAYGTGAKLGGKTLVASVTTGAPAKLYEEGGVMGHTVETFLFPLQQTAKLCNLTFVKPVVSNGMAYIPGVNSEEDLQRVLATAHEHADRLVKVLQDL